MPEKRVWGFAPKGSKEFKEYLQRRREATKALTDANYGVAQNLEGRAKQINERLSDSFSAGGNKSARELLELHGSFLDGGLPEASIEAGARMAAKLPLKNHEKPIAALFIARAHYSLRRVYKDRNVWGKLREDLKNYAKQDGLKLQKLYDAIGMRRTAAADRRIKRVGDGVVRQELRHRIAGHADIPEHVWRGEQSLVGLRKKARE